MKILAKDTKIISNRQYAVLLSIILFGILVGPFSIAINIKRDTYIVAAVESFLFFAGIWLFFYIQKLSDYKMFIRISFTALTIFFSLIIYMTYNPNSSPGTFFLVFTVPTLSYVVLGKKYGCIMSFVFGGLTLFAYYFSNKIHPGFQLLNTYNATVTFLAIWYVSHVYERSNVYALEKMQKISVTDSLTQIYNRKVIADIDNLHQQKTVLSYVVLDVDFFKRVNDNYGHDTGDRVLVFLAEELGRCFDEIGYVIRLGGEEFCIIVPHKSIVQTKKLCEKCLAEVRKKSINHEDNNIHITFSAGVASSTDDGNNYSELLKIADKRLYKAKNSGRNCVVAV